MPNLHYEAYQPSFIFKNPHINSIYPSLFRRVNDIDYQRVRMTLSDGDFIDLDYSRKDSGRVVILCHGLEGNSSSKYIRGMARHFNRNGYDAVGVNYRGCSGEMNRKFRMYNSGATEDLHDMVTFIEKDYEEIHLIGFSLGGNLVLKYAGEKKFPLSSKIKSIVAFSTPTSLSHSSKALETPSTRVYKNRFLVSLKEKMRQKNEQFPGRLDMDLLDRVETVWEFDEHFTGPIHGYKGAEDYYEKCHSGQFLKNITLPTLLVNALDDPFLTEECMPFQDAKDSDHFYFLPSQYGGHVGWSSFKKTFWSEKVALIFINKTSTLINGEWRMEIGD